jgi:hypothetical protein
MNSILRHSNASRSKIFYSIIQIEKMPKTLEQYLAQCFLSDEYNNEISWFFSNFTLNFLDCYSKEILKKSHWRCK